MKINTECGFRNMDMDKDPNIKVIYNAYLYIYLFGTDPSPYTIRGSFYNNFDKKQRYLELLIFNDNWTRLHLMANQDPAALVVSLSREPEPEYLFRGSQSR